MIVFIGLLVGIIIGVIFPGSIPDKFSPYLSIAIVACLDSVFGAIKASLKKEFQADVFISRILWKCSFSSFTSISR